MKFKSITLFTNSLEKERDFYTDNLQLKLTSHGQNHFTVRVGWTELTFRSSRKKHVYHYCFLIPANQFQRALQWMSARTNLIEIEPGRFTQRFETWNADSFYFFDGSGNLAECIVRHDLPYRSKADFNENSLLGVNEIGMPTTEIAKLNEALSNHLGSQFWKGDLMRFGTHGDQEGIFLLPNYQVKDGWFPGNQKILVEPFDIFVEHELKLRHLRFRNGQLTDLETHKILY